MTDAALTGTVTFGADKTYRSNVTLTGKVLVMLPASCLVQQGVTVTCAQLEQSVQAAAAEDGFLSVSCTGSNGCTCAMQIAPRSGSSTGTYSTSGNQVLMSSSAGTSESNDYCVTGNQLTLVGAEAMSGGKSELHLTRQ